MMLTGCSPRASCSLTKCTARRQSPCSTAREISKMTPLRDTGTMSSTSRSSTRRRSAPRYTSSLLSSLSTWRVLSLTRWMKRSSAALSNSSPRGLALSSTSICSSPSQPGLEMSIFENSRAEHRAFKRLKKLRRLSTSPALSTKKVCSGSDSKQLTSFSKPACTASLRAPCGVSARKFAPLSHTTLRPPNILNICKPPIVRRRISRASSTVAAVPSICSLPQPSSPAVNSV